MDGVRASGWRSGWETGLRNRFTAVEHETADGIGASGLSRGCALLTPRRLDEASHWYEPVFRDQYGCGAFALAPGQPLDLGRWVVSRLEVVEVAEEE